MNGRNMTYTFVLLALLAVVVALVLKLWGRQNGVPVRERYDVPEYGTFLQNNDARSREAWRREFDRLGGG